MTAQGHGAPLGVKTLFWKQMELMVARHRDGPNARELCTLKWFI